MAATTAIGNAWKILTEKLFTDDEVIASVLDQQLNDDAQSMNKHEQATVEPLSNNKLGEHYIAGFKNSERFKVVYDV